MWAAGEPKHDNLVNPCLERAVGAFDTAIVASVKLAGGTRLLSFAANARALASAEAIGVFPVLAPTERRRLARLKR
jgi:hypothetical protein